MSDSIPAQQALTPVLFRQPEVPMNAGAAVEILYRHADFIAVNKPAGVSVQQENGVAAFLPAVAAQLAVPRLWLVHRLDKATSGVLLLALHAEGASVLAQMFAHQAIRKTYWAVAAGKPVKKQGWVKGDMAKARRGGWKLLRSHHNPAITWFDSIGLGAGLRLYRMQPQSGKTHQLRVAMKSLGCPILGDTRYGGAEAERLFLHARRLVLVYKGQPLDIVAEPPAPWPQTWREQG